MPMDEVVGVSGSLYKGIGPATSGRQFSMRDEVQSHFFPENTCAMEPSGLFESSSISDTSLHRFALKELYEVPRCPRWLATCGRKKQWELREMFKNRRDCALRKLHLSSSRMVSALVVQASTAIDGHLSC